jgi:hypothetical protein
MRLVSALSVLSAAFLITSTPIPGPKDQETAISTFAQTFLPTEPWETMLPQPPNGWTPPTQPLKYSDAITPKILCDVADNVYQTIRDMKDWKPKAAGSGLSASTLANVGQLVTTLYTIAPTIFIDKPFEEQLGYGIDCGQFSEALVKPLVTIYRKLLTKMMREYAATAMCNTVQLEPCDKALKGALGYARFLYVYAVHKDRPAGKF